MAELDEVEQEEMKKLELEEMAKIKVEKDLTGEKKEEAVN